KTYTPINYKMQQYAEEAQREWMKQLQAEFDKQWRRRDAISGNNARLLETGMKRSDRYRELKRNGASDEEIKKAFNTKVSMSLFSCDGTEDTKMTPMVPIKYNKLIVRNSLMATEPLTGHIKAWVGGVSSEHHRYDQVNFGIRQTGS